MINVRRLANYATRNVNPNATVTLRVNQGYTVSVAGKQVPSYVSQTIEIQPQSLSSTEKQALDLVNKQGEYISVYAYGDVNAIRRWVAKGSSQIVFPAYGESANVTWNVEQVLESYATWVRLLLCRL